MFQIVYENEKSWPTEGPLLVEAPAISTEIAVSPDTARRRVNGYLVTYVSMTTHAIHPVLILGERPVWRLTIEMRLRKLGPVATVGVIDVDAFTGEVIGLSESQIRAIQDRANDIITYLAPQAA